MSGLDKNGLASLKFGDIIENGYAAADNPTRIGVFIRFKTVPRGQINAGKVIECRSDNGTFWTTDIGNDRLRKIGSIPADRAAQAERMARLEEATIERCAKVCEDQASQFLSPQYATNQPIGSITERFACEECAAAIRALSQEGSDA